MQEDRKTAEAEKKTPRPWGKKNVGWQKIVSWEKKCRLEKNVGWKISPAISGNVRTFPGMQDRKTAEGGKKPLGPMGEKKVRQKKNCRLEIYFFCRLGKKMSVGKFHLPFEGMSGHSLECKTEKGQRQKKNP